jgi:hypothetical protein
MADIQWPGSLPVYGQRDGYSEQFPDIAIRTPMSAGPDKVRLGAPGGIREIAVTLLLTDAEYGIFKTFYHEITRDGALAFDFTHQRTGATIEVYFAEEEPKATPASGGHWLVSFSVEKMDDAPEV